MQSTKGKKYLSEMLCQKLKEAYLYPLEKESVTATLYLITKVTIASAKI